MLPSLTWIKCESKPPSNMVPTRILIQINLSLCIHLIWIRSEFDPLLIRVSGPCERDFMVLYGLVCSMYLEVFTQFTKASGAKMCCNQFVSHSAMKCYKSTCLLICHTLKVHVTPSSPPSRLPPSSPLVSFGPL